MINEENTVADQPEQEPVYRFDYSQLKASRGYGRRRDVNPVSEARDEARGAGPEPDRRAPAGYAPWADNRDDYAP